MTMNPTSSQIDLEDEYGNDVMGTVQWRTTAFTNDTLVFIPQNALKPATGYSYEGNGQSATGGTWFDASFITKYSMADATPPTVETTYPYNGMINVLTGERIVIRFSEAMNPSTINSANITISGLTSSDYSVNYDIGRRDVEIRKNTPFTASSTYTATITTNVRDIRGNPLKNQYQWSFTTGAADTTRPTVTQTIPTNLDIKVNLFPNLYAIFSEEMDETTFTPTNITLYDNTVPGWVPVNIYWSGEDSVSFGPQSALTYNHNYTVTIGTGVKDRAGNTLLNPYPWSFTTATSGTIDSDPIINWGLSRDDQIGQRWSNGTTKVDLELGAWDDVTSSLTVTATTPPAYVWNLTGSPGGYNYSYVSAGNESLSAGPHTVTFTIQDGAANTVTFHRDIYIFTASPILSLPANGATGVSTTPTFQWSYSGGDRPMYYIAAVFDGPDMNEDRMIWIGYMADMGSGTHSITIPADKQLAPNTTYYWGVRGANREENGETFGGLWPFTTGGTPPPAAYFIWTYVRSDDIYPPALQGNLVAKVAGPSPADIVQLKVTGPGGFQYIFTEDDIWRSEQLGQFYQHNFPNPLSNGTYTFSITDSAERTVTTTRDFTLVSVPRVDYTTMSPGDNWYVNTTTPTLSWGSVGPGYYYRVSIWDWNGNQSPVYISDFIQDTSIIIPSGVLFPNTPYNWRVDVFDAPILGSNRSRSNALQFSTGDSSYIPGNMIEWVNFYSDNNHYSGIGKSISTNVLGPLPDDVIQFSVTGPDLIPDFQQTSIMYNLAWQRGSMYAFSQPGALTGGIYDLNLQTPLGSDTYQKDLTRSDIPIVVQSTLSHANNAYLSTLTPTLTWSGVAGSPRYYRVMIQDWRRRFVIYVSTRSTDLFAAIPDGILKPNMSYMWRVEVYDNANGIVADNRSTSGWNCFTTPRPSLVDHYYTSILRRTPDPGGKAYWESEVERTQTLGIDIKEGYMVMSGNFFNSAEYFGFGRTNDEFLTDLYLTFFNRAPDPGGLSYWLSELSAGSSRDMVMYYFMFSPEFNSFMSELFGDTTTRAEIYAVVDFYRGILDRLPDDSGFSYWLDRFRAAQCTGAGAVTAEVETISQWFFSSPEYTNRGRTNAQFVQDCYYTFMRRYATASEVNWWANELNTGARDRDQVRREFIASPEFQGRVNAMIAQGCYSP
jgi:hypothetical protein